METAAASSLDERALHANLLTKRAAAAAASASSGGHAGASGAGDDAPPRVGSAEFWEALRARTLRGLERQLPADGSAQAGPAGQQRHGEAGRRGEGSDAAVEAGR